jgi:hypothetical protein
MLRLGWAGLPGRFKQYPAFSAILRRLGILGLAMGTFCKDHGAHILLVAGIIP